MKILITGATSGIGEELARQLQGKGKLLLTGRNKDKLHQLQPLGDILECDLARSAEPVLQWIEKEKPDLIFNNAGFGLYGQFDKLSQEEIESMIRVNCLTLSEITHKAIGMWKKEGKPGTLMNVASMASYVPFPTGALYGATKAFVRHLSFSLDVENRGHGIRVLCTCPGMVATEFAKRATRGKGISQLDRWVVMDTERAVRKIIKQVEKKRPVQVVDERYQLLNFLNKLVPDSLVGQLISWNLKKRL